VVSSNPYEIVNKFEQALCDFTGAKYAVATTSCTMALLLACSYECRPINTWLHIASTPQKESEKKMRAEALEYGRDIVHSELRMRITIPSRTYIGVPQSIIHAGAWPFFVDKKWSGGYQLEPLPIWDYARRFTSGMYVPGQMQCVSFHWTKILSIGQGGAILHDNLEADDYLRRARFDGRRADVPASEDNPKDLGYHAYMMPRDAAEGLTRLKFLPKHNEDLPWDDYPELDKMELFK